MTPPGVLFLYELITEGGALRQELLFSRPSVRPLAFGYYN